jgi:hypothetical protein
LRSAPERTGRPPARTSRRTRQRTII